MKTYYEILEVAINDTHNDICNAYKKKSLEYITQINILLMK